MSAADHPAEPHECSYAFVSAHFPARDAVTMTMTVTLRCSVREARLFLDVMRSGVFPGFPAELLGSAIEALTTTLATVEPPPAAPVEN